MFVGCNAGFGILGDVQGLNQYHTRTARDLPALPEGNTEGEIMNHSITAPATKITKSYKN